MLTMFGTVNKLQVQLNFFALIVWFGISIAPAFASSTKIYMDPHGNNTIGTSWQTAFTSPKNIDWPTIVRTQKRDQVFELVIGGGTYSDPLVLPNLLQVTIHPSNVPGHNGAVIFKANASTPPGSAAIDMSSCAHGFLDGDNNYVDGKFSGAPKTFGITIDGFDVGVNLGGTYNTPFGLAGGPNNGMWYVTVQNCKQAGVKLGTGTATGVTEIISSCNLVNNGTAPGGAHILKTDPNSLCNYVITFNWIHNTDDVPPTDGISFVGNSHFLAGGLEDIASKYPIALSFTVLGPGLNHNLIANGDVSLQFLESLFINGQASNLTCQNYIKQTKFNVQSCTFVSLPTNRNGQVANNLELMSPLPQGFRLVDSIVAGATVKVLPSILNTGSSNIVNATGNTRFVAPIITAAPLFNSNINLSGNTPNSILAGLDFTPVKAAKGHGSYITSVHAMTSYW